MVSGPDKIDLEFLLLAGVICLVVMIRVVLLPVLFFFLFSLSYFRYLGLGFSSQLFPHSSGPSTAYVGKA